MGGRSQEYQAPRRIRGVLFDKDGTLFEYHGTWVPILFEVAAMVAGDEALALRLIDAVGYDAESGRIKAGSLFAGGDTLELADAWLRLGVKREREDLVRSLDETFARLAPASSVPVTDLAALFSTLTGRGMKLGLATNDVEASARALMGRLALDPFLSFQAGYDSGHGTKPAPGMALAFCAAVGLTPAAIAIVGDNLHDLEFAARAGAGLKVGVLTGTSGRADLEPHADAVIDSVADLPALLDRFG